MLIIKLQGGLGNQLFQYAYGLKMSRLLGKELYLDTSFLEIARPGVTPRAYELFPYKVAAKILSHDELAKIGVVRSPYIVKILTRLNLGFRKCKYFREGNYELVGIKNIKNGYRLVFDGYWQNEKLFSGVESELMDQILSYKSNSSLVDSILDAINNCNSVALHIRRGDYITNIAAAKFHALCGLDYYSAAIEYFGENVASPHFFVFTDDPEWAKTNINTDHALTFVSGSGELNHHDELSLMAHCRHNIIANSTFSWWGAWLNSNPEKKIIVPREWHKNKINAEGLLPSNWLTIS